MRAEQAHQPNGHAPAVRVGAHRLDHETAMSQRVAQFQCFPLFSGISPADCRTIISAAHEKEFHPRQSFFLEGQPVRQTLLLISGCAKITQLGQNGTEVILRLHGPSDIVGGCKSCSPATHHSTARALQLSTALVWEAAVFEAFTLRFPILRCNIGRILGRRLLEMEERFREISTEKVAPRLGRTIIRLLTQVGQRVNGSVEINLSREELAQLTGTTLFTVSRLLSAWERQGIVSTRRRAVMISNHQALLELSDSE